MSAENERTKTHLRRLGVNPMTVARLEGFADEDEMTLKEFVVFVLGDYAPPEEIEEAS